MTLTTTKDKQTQREVETAIIDFSIGRGIEKDSEIRYQAKLFLNERKVEKGRMLSRVIAATIEEGIVYQYMFDYLNERGESWEKWVNEQSPYDADTARHYRNVAGKFRELIAEQPDDVLQRTKLSALYKLAVQDVPVSTAIAFFEVLAANPDLEGDVRLAAIMKNPEIATRYEKNELTKPQAYDLVRAIENRDLNQFIRQLCLSERVSWGGVVEWLNRIYLDYCRTQDADRPAKTWAEMVENDFTMVWDDNAGSWSVHISHATAADCRAYMNARQLEKIQQRIGDKELQQSRATCRVERKSDGTISLTILDSTALPVDFKTGTILVDLLPESLEIEKK